MTEACDAFSSLGLQCEMSELLSYAGLCWIAAARCEGSLGNAPSEVNCLLRAARQFVKAEYRDKTLGCPSPANEHLQVNICTNIPSSLYLDFNWLAFVGIVKLLYICKQPLP